MGSFRWKDGSRTDGRGTALGEESGLGWHLRNKLVNVILCVALAGPLFFGIAFHPVVVQNVSGGYFDFVSFYTAGQVVKQGLRKHLYNYDTQREFQRNLTGRPAPLPYNHTPFETLVFVPLTFVPYLWAYRLWVLVNLLLVGFSAYLLRRSEERRVGKECRSRWS